MPNALTKANCAIDAMGTEAKASDIGKRALRKTTDVRARVVRY
jgi:hypothetical protein